MKNSKHPLGPWSTEDFIRSCWQQEPLLIPAAMTDIQSLVSKQDLISIACQPEAEARLITGNPKQSDWQCQQGPFKSTTFKSLSAKTGTKKNWTLLVQAVDQWMPEVATLLQRFDFLPRWRLDDIMISYATEGGGVGPHFDQYDVFLIQLSGTRHWQIGQRCDDQTPLRAHPDMKLLQQFKKVTSYEVQAGDLLYIPSGVAHWGTATSDDCITVSVGFRAASQGELLQMALHHIAHQLPDSLRYRDTEESMDKDPFCINDHAAREAQQFFKNLDAEQIKSALTQALGEYATEPRYPDYIVAESTLTLKKLARLLQNKKIVALEHHYASRFAWHPLDNKRAELYVDGETHRTSLKLAKAICHSAVDTRLLKNDTDQHLFLLLVNQGSLILL